MDIKAVKKEIWRTINTQLGHEDKVTPRIIEEKTNEIIDYTQKTKKTEISGAVKEEIINSLCDDFLGYGPLQRFMDDPQVSEIMVNGPHKIYIEKEGKKILASAKFDDEIHLRYIIEKMLSDTGRWVDESSPYVDFALTDGSRVNVIIHPVVAQEEAVITIRKFLRAIEKIEDLVRLNSINARIAEFLVACVKAKVNIIFSGATGSGKTTTLEVLSSYISPEERIITIEDVLEIRLRQEHVVKLLTKPANIEGKGQITLRDLFRNTLRMRPTRIILGEIRGEEAMDYLQALNSGHRGCLAVIHASSPADAINRLETMALYAGLNLPSWAIRQQIASGLNLIIQHELFPDGSRKLSQITQVNGLKDGNVVLDDIFVYEIESINSEGKIQGGWRAKGVLPVFYPLFKKVGINLPETIFKQD